MRGFLILLVSTGLLFYSVFSIAADALNVDQVISSTRSAANADKQANAARERKFRAQRNKQQGRLTAIKNERARQERISDQLDAQFQVNETKLEALADELAKELGDLKELFGVIQTTASEAQEDFKTSIISAQFPGRAEDLRRIAAKMGNSNELVSINEIEQIWVHLQNEMTQQGKIAKYTLPVNVKTGDEVDEEGNVTPIYEKQDREITRVGVFSAVTDKDIAVYDNSLGGFLLFDRQMGKQFTGKSENLQKADSGVEPFYIDPAKGGLLKALVRKPNLFEKIQEGKVIGYLIILLGLMASSIALYRIWVLGQVRRRVRRQAKDMKRPSLKNPLGRMIQIYQNNQNSDSETMELKLSEAILKETPRLNSKLLFVKIAAVVAPLMGLLGTVTGMIQTFQAITLFGAGDPQMMAGGISQALVTTVLGLVVAIPTVFLHWFASSRAKEVEEIMEECATNLIAEQINNHGEQAAG